MDIKAKEERDKVQHDHDIKMTELGAKLQYEQEALNDIKRRKDMENEIKQKEKEIEDAKKKIRDAEDALAKKAAEKAKKAAQNPPQASPPNAPPPPRPMFASAARDKWEHQKRVDGAQNDALDKIMGMTGLEQVKEQVLRVKGSLDTMHRQGVPINKERLNLALLGNPGTGETCSDSRKRRMLI